MKDNNKLNLMHVTFSLDTGGAEKLLVELIDRVDKSLFTPSVCCLTKEGDLSKKLRTKGIEIFYLHKKEGVDYCLPFKLAKIIKRKNADIIHTHDSTANLYAVAAAKIAGRSNIFNTEHGGIYFETDRKKFINKLLCLFNNVMICVSSSIRDDLVSMGLPIRKLAVIPNGIDSNKFIVSIDAERKRRSIGLDDSDFVICLIGRLSQEKNQRMLLDAVRPILKKVPNTKFLIVGDGPLRESLEKDAERLGLRTQVKFLGTRNDVPEILKISDCFVACSDFESFGLSVLEAMAAGVPVISTCAGGLKEIVKNQETGILIEKNDKAALIDGVYRIRNDSLLRDKMIYNAKKMVKEHYGIEKMVKNYENLYLEYRKN